MNNDLISKKLSELSFSFDNIFSFDNNFAEKFTFYLFIFALKIIICL
jgi:hypothetical protein